MMGHVERIEQAGNRICITTGGLVHDMYCDGTLENGVDDIAGSTADGFASPRLSRTASTSCVLGRGGSSWLLAA